MILLNNVRKIPVSILSNDEQIISSDYLASESLVKLNLTPSKSVNLLASPDCLDDLFIGHLISEGYLNSNSYLNPKQILTEQDKNGTIIVSYEEPLELSREISSEKPVSTSCGACNNDSLELLISSLPLVDIRKTNLSLDLLNKGFESMKLSQNGFKNTGGMHCTGLLKITGEFLIAREDIGRHNAVDKLIGASINDHNLNDCILLLSGRCGWDIIAKAARANIPCIASLGAASTLAAETARKLGIKLYTFVKPDRSVIIG